MAAASDEKLQERAYQRPWRHHDQCWLTSAGIKLPETDTQQKDLEEEGRVEQLEPQADPIPGQHIYMPNQLIKEKSASNREMTFFNL